jgi:hypothetical protein
LQSIGSIRRCRLISNVPVQHFNPLNPSKEKTMSLINTQVQPFKAQAFHNGKFIEVTEASLKGKWSVLIFMPAAFTFNCPTEIEDAPTTTPSSRRLAPKCTSSPPTPTSRTRSGTKPRRPSARPSSRWSATRRTQLTNAFGVHIDGRRPGAARHLRDQPGRRDQDRWKSTPTKSPVTCPKPCAS